MTFNVIPRTNPSEGHFVKKMNALGLLEFELAYYNTIVQPVSQYITETFIVSSIPSNDIVPSKSKYMRGKVNGDRKNERIKE